MRIFILTQIGDSIAANPSNSNSNAYRFLSYLRRHGNQASDLQLKDHLGLNGGELQRTANELEQAKAVKCIVSS